MTIKDAYKALQERGDAFIDIKRPAWVPGDAYTRIYADGRVIFRRACMTVNCLVADWFADDFVETREGMVLPGEISFPVNETAQLQQLKRMSDAMWKISALLNRSLEKPEKKKK